MSRDGEMELIVMVIILYTVVAVIVLMMIVKLEVAMMLEASIEMLLE